MKKGLVSIITPCYNGEEYIDTYAMSILGQSYSNLELIFIDDGSTDHTGEKINSYKAEFEKKKIKYHYIYQENKGQAVAINEGLKLVEGEFLTWPDSDDILHRDSIEKRVKFLQENPKYDLVRNEVTIIDFNTKEKLGEFKVKEKYRKDDILEDLIFENHVFYAPISYMIRTEKFLEFNPERKIFETRFGQNWQILLPICYYGKCGYLEENLCDYVVRRNSHSRQAYKTIQEEFFKYDKHIEILEQVLSPMGIFEQYKDRIYVKYDREKLKQAYNYQNYDFAKKAWKHLKKYGNPDLKDYVFYYGTKYKIIHKITKLMKRILKGKK